MYESIFKYCVLLTSISSIVLPVLLFIIIVSCFTEHLVNSFYIFCHANPIILKCSYVSVWLWLWILFLLLLMSSPDAGTNRKITLDSCKWVWLKQHSGIQVRISPTCLQCLWPYSFVLSFIQNHILGFFYFLGSLQILRNQWYTNPALKVLTLCSE